MRRFKQAVSEEECRKILREEWRAAFSVIGDEGYPYTIPINFYYEESENRIYSTGQGDKVSALEKCDKVCFTVWNQGYKKRAIGNGMSPAL